MAQRNKKWLSLQEAADQLGVHFTTVRRWVDQGAIPTLLTPGGHRRFSPEDLEEFARRHRRHYVREGLEDSWHRQALSHTRSEIGNNRNAAWMSRFDIESSTKLRILGKELMEVTTMYIGSGEEDNERARIQAEEIGRQYGELTYRGGMSLSETLHAMQFFKNSLIEATVSMPEAQAKPQLNTRILRRMNEILGAVEVSVARVYESK